MKNILVIGGTGFLGAAIVRRVLHVSAPKAAGETALREADVADSLTRDNIRSMRAASVCESDCALPLPFGRRATALETIAPIYLRA